MPEMPSRDVARSAKRTDSPGRASLTAAATLALLLGASPVSAQPSAARIQSQAASLEAWKQDLCAGSPPLSKEDLEDSREIAGRSAELNFAQDMMSMGEFENVASILCRLLAIRSKEYGLAHPRTVSVLNSYGVLLRKEGQNARSRRLLEDLVAISESYPAELRRATLQNLGAALYAQGYMAASQAVFQRALASAEQDGQTSNRSIGTTLTNLAFALEAQRRYREAESFHRRALDLRPSADDALALDRAASLNNLGANLSAQERYEDAGPLLEESLAIRTLHLGGDSLNAGYSLANLGANALGNKRPAEAVRFATQLVNLRTEALGAAHPETALAQQLLARAKYANQDFAGSLAAARAALASRVPFTQRESLAISDSARASLRSVSAPAALVLVRSAWELSGGQAAVWSPGTPPPTIDEAFVAAQRIPASNTADAFGRSTARALASERGLDALSLQYQLAEDARAAADFALAQLIADGAPAEAAKARRNESERQVLDAERALAAEFPEFFDFARPQPVELARLASDPGKLGPEDALILLTPGADRMRGVVWVVTQNGGGAWAEIALDPDELDKQISEFRLGLDLAAEYSTVDDGGGESADFSRARANVLYVALFGSPQLAAILSAKKHWILVPQGSLVALPFAALVVDESDASTGEHVAARLRATRWLGLERTLSLLPSVSSLLANAHSRLRSGTVRFFGIGDPMFKGRPDAKPGRLADYFDERGGRVDSVHDLPALPGTRLEIEMIAERLGAHRSDYLLGVEASETELRSARRARQLSEAQIIAFATHGLVSGEIFGTVAEPALALTPPPSQTDVDDGLLTASEVARLDLRAELVLLSACRTAAGNTLNSEGLTGLARAFFAAGAHNLLVSHWRVRDDVASRLTVRTIELMRGSRPLGAAEASRLAMSELVADPSADRSEISFAHPAIWAAFATVGSY